MTAINHNYQFDSVSELLAALEIPATNSANQNSIQSVLFSGGGKWVCSDRQPESLDEAKQHLAAPLYQKGADRVERLLSKIHVPTPVSRVRRRVWADAGDEMCRDRLYAGQIDTMWSTAKRKATVGPSRVHVVLTVRAQGHVDSVDMARRGAVGVAITQALRAAGYVVRLSGRVNNEIHTYGGTELYQSTVTLIREGEALDLHKLASLAASSLLFRGVILAHEMLVATQPVSTVVPPLAGNDSPEFPGFDTTIRVMDIPKTEDEMSDVVTKALVPFAAREGSE